MQAGCDLILHCNGILGEMELVANTVCKTPKDLHLRIAGAGNLRKTRLLQDNFDPNHGLVRLTSKITDS